MSNEITATQIRYLSALLKNFEAGKYDDLKRELRISKKTSIPELTRDEAYHLLTRLITQSKGKDVEQALTVALEKTAVS